MNRSMTGALVVLAMSVAVSCGQSSTDRPAGTVSLLFAGDLMMGRGVASMVSADPDGLFADIRSVVQEADFSFANLESPLTDATLVASHPYDLRAASASAALVAAVGFDVLGLANNHAGDAGPVGLADSISTIRAAGMEIVGAGDAGQAYEPVISEADGVRLAVLAFDVSGLGLPAGPQAGVAQWGDEARAAIGRATAVAHVVVVGLHGGAAYVDADPVLWRAGREAVASGADVVWSHGAHVQLPTGVVGDAIVADGLGNLLFDQAYPGTRQGTLLEVVAGAEGVVAWRTGAADHASGRVRFSGWDRPEGDAVLIDGEWWNLMPGVAVRPGEKPALEGFPHGDVVATGMGDVDGDGVDEVVVSFRRPFRRTLLNMAAPERWLDAEGRTAHVGVFEVDDLTSVWIAGTLRRPVADLSVCDGSMAVAYDTLDDDAIVAVGGWMWNGFGFIGDVDLEGSAALGCVDVDGDGATEPALTGREFRH